MRIVFLLLGGQMKDFSRFRAGNLEHVAHDIQVLPTDENFDSA